MMQMMRKALALLLVAACLLPACSRSALVSAGEGWRDSLCREKYGQDCQDPGDIRRGPPDHNDPLEETFGRVP